MKKNHSHILLLRQNNLDRAVQCDLAGPMKKRMYVHSVVQGTEPCMQCKQPIVCSVQEMKLAWLPLVSATALV